MQAPGAPDASIFSRERATRPRRRGEGPQGCCLLPILTVRSGLTANCQVCRGILHLKRSGQDPLLQESARIVVPMKQIALSLVVIAGSGAYVWQQSTSMPVDDVLGPAVPSDMADRHSGPLAIPATSADPAASPAAALPDLRPRLEPRVMPAAIGKETTASITPPKPDRQKVGVPRFPQASPKPAESAPTIATVQPSAAVDRQEISSFAVTPAVYIPIPQPRPDYPQAPARVVRTGMKAAAANSATQRFNDGTYSGPVTDAYYGPMQIQVSIQGGRLTSLKVLKYPSDRRTSVRINREALPMLRDEAISAQSADVDIISGATLSSRAFIQSLNGALRKASS